MKRLSITLTDQQEKELEAIARKSGASKQSLISLAITQWLNRNRDTYLPAKK